MAARFSLLRGVEVHAWVKTVYTIAVYPAGRTNSMGDGLEPSDKQVWRDAWWGRHKVRTQFDTAYHQEAFYIPAYHSYP